MPVHVGIFDISSIKNNDSCMGGDPDTPHPLTILLTVGTFSVAKSQMTTASTTMAHLRLKNEDSYDDHELDTIRVTVCTFERLGLGIRGPPEGGGGGLGGQSHMPGSFPGP